MQENLDRDEVSEFIDHHRDVEMRKSLSRGSVDPPLAIDVGSSSASPTKDVVDPAVRMTVNKLIDYTILMKDVLIENDADADENEGPKSPTFDSPVKAVLNTAPKPDGNQKEDEIQTEPSSQANELETVLS